MGLRKCKFIEYNGKDKIDIRRFDDFRYLGHKDLGRF